MPGRVSKTVSGSTTLRRGLFDRKKSWACMKWAMQLCGAGAVSLEALRSVLWSLRSWLPQTCKLGLKTILSRATPNLGSQSQFLRCWVPKLFQRNTSWFWSLLSTCTTCWYRGALSLLDYTRMSWKKLMMASSLSPAHRSRECINSSFLLSKLQLL